MNTLERILLKIRHSSALRDAWWFWRPLKLLYDGLGPLLLRNGIGRTINGSDYLRVPARLRIGEIYEPEAWFKVMGQVRSGDTIADVGAYIGLYSVGFARRTGCSGRVLAFEPDVHNVRKLRSIVRLNRLSNVEVLPLALGAQDCTVPFVMRRRDPTMSSVMPNSVECASYIQQVTLDTMFAQSRLDLLKIDVEGYELEVLRGGISILRNLQRGPRCVVVEIHPSPLKMYGGSGKALIDLLHACGYCVTSLDGDEIDDVTAYTHILAFRVGLRAVIIS